MKGTDLLIVPGVARFRSFQMLHLCVDVSVPAPDGWQVGSTSGYAVFTGCFVICFSIVIDCYATERCAYLPWVRATRRTTGFRDASRAILEPCA